MAGEDTAAIKEPSGGDSAGDVAARVVRSEVVGVAAEAVLAVQPGNTEEESTRKLAVVFGVPAGVIGVKP